MNLCYLAINIFSFIFIKDRYIDFSKQKLPFVHETARYLINTNRLFKPMMAYFMDAYICPHIPMSWDGFWTGFLLYYDYLCSDTYKLSVPVDPKMCFLKPEACMYIFILWIHNEFMKLMFTINYFVHTRANHSQYDPPLMQRCINPGGGTFIDSIYYLTIYLSTISYFIMLTKQCVNRNIIFCQP